MKKYDYLVVGAGLFGAVFAQQAKACGKNVLVIDKRNHIAGNVYTENQHSINVHKYGAHIFHTDYEDVWQYVNQFAAFNHVEEIDGSEKGAQIVSLEIERVARAVGRAAVKQGYPLTYRLLVGLVIDASVAPEVARNLATQHHLLPVIAFFQKTKLNGSQVAVISNAKL